MNGIWIASMLLQWAMILVLSLLALSLMRQLGKLGLKLNRTPEREEIFAPFAGFPQRALALVNGGTFRIGGEQKTPCLVVFFSPKCSACEHLSEAVRKFVETNRPEHFAFLAVMDVERSGVEKYIAQKSLESVPIAILEDIPEHLRPGGVPFGVAIAADGRIAASGKPKNLAHLLEMAHAARLMAGLSRQTHEWGESVPCWVAGQSAATSSASFAKAT